MRKISLLLTCVLFLFSCSDDDNKELQQRENYFQQGWKLYSVKNNGSDVDISDRTLPELMYFGEKNVCYLATPIFSSGNWVYVDSRTAWNYDYSNNILNIAEMLPVTCYVDVIQKDRLVLRYYVYNTAGSLDMVEKEFQPAQVEIVNLRVRLLE